MNFPIDITLQGFELTVGEAKAQHEGQVIDLKLQQIIVPHMGMRLQLPMTPDRVEKLVRELVGPSVVTASTMPGALVGQLTCRG